MKIDQVADLALLSVSAYLLDVKAILRGTMDELSIGADVHAIGHQTGNSRGPPLSSSGKLVGLNSFKASGEVLNCAVSVEDAEVFLDRENYRLANAPYADDSSSASDCASDPIEIARNKEDNGTIALFDLDCDGEVDAMLTEPDDQLDSPYMEANSTGNGIVDTVFYDEDEDRDGDIDYEVNDISAKGEPDLMHFYHNGDDTPPRTEKVS